jgi:hypothetical protein
MRWGRGVNTENTGGTEEGREGGSRKCISSAGSSRQPPVRQLRNVSPTRTSPRPSQSLRDVPPERRASGTCHPNVEPQGRATRTWIPMDVPPTVTSHSQKLKPPTNNHQLPLYLPLSDLCVLSVYPLRPQTLPHQQNPLTQQALANPCSS